MTIAADGWERTDRSDIARWGVSLGVVLLLHAALGVYLASRHILAEDTGPQAPAVLIDLAPLPVPAPPAPPPPEPLSEPQAQPQPIDPVPAPPPPPLEMPKLEPSPAPRPLVTVPQKPPTARPRPIERPREVLPRVPPPPAAPPIAAPPAPAPAAPPLAANAGALRASWQQQVAAKLARNKRYPRLAQEQREQGVATVHFAVDRQGRLLSATIVRSSGFSLLDEEALALVQRAQPLPPPPPEVPGAHIELTVPVRFSLDQSWR